jgi:ABC-type multidrug transport system fused ATPase/permease subunit
MVEPLFMRFIIDRVLLDDALSAADRISRLHLAGSLFVAVVILTQFVTVLKDYRQRLLNTRVMLSLRRALFERLLHLPLPKLWDMKTGGILSRITGDVDTTTGLLQMAVVSPSISLVRLIIAVAVLMTLNWRLALTALAIIPGIVLMSFAFARRVRPIYRSVRKNAEEIDGRVGETFSGIRVVRAFGREKRELIEYMHGRHTVLRKELFASRREMVIRFEDVEFEYREQRPVVREFDVVVPGGSVVALVGRSGAGKTTVTDLVARFHDPTRGRITLNGIDLRDFRLRSYRSLLAIVQQDVFLFDGSVRDNIAYGRHDASDEEIEDAARRANAHEFIVRLPDQYDTFVGERGVKLSGGQQQRLAIARAFLASPRILILDEATSNLDTESEQLIQASMASLLAGRTTFVIAHRLSTIRRADLILLMEDGRIIERGTHADLMHARGTYSEMVRRQMESHGEESGVDFEPVRSTI